MGLPPENSNIIRRAVKMQGYLISASLGGCGLCRNDLAPAYDQGEALFGSGQQVERLQWISCYQDKVGNRTGGNYAQFSLPVQEAGVDGGC